MGAYIFCVYHNTTPNMAKKRVSKIAKGKRAKKGTKSTKRSTKAKHVSKIAKGKRAKSQVLKGRKAKTSSGLQAKDLKKNKNGKVVSKKQSARGKVVYLKNGLGKWTAAVVKARK